jgi:membrane peptidoglycan carboxypeptidase
MQPGSTMKPVTLAAWLNEGKPTNQVVDAARRVYPLNYPWRDTCGRVRGAYDDAEVGLGAANDLQNDEPGWYRPMSVREGIAQSINTATFASAAGLNDFCDIQRAADALGMHNGAGKGQKLDLSTLGNLLGGENVAPMTMANAFATFAAGGAYCAPVSITEVDDSQGKKIGGQTQSCQADALKPGVAAAATNVLQDVATKGSGLLIPQKLGAPDAMKTGTNQYNNQTWVVGYTRGLATASFFGDPFNSTARRTLLPRRRRRLHRRPPMGPVHAAGPGVLRPRGLRRSTPEPHRWDHTPAPDSQQRPVGRRHRPGPSTPRADHRPPAHRPRPDQARQREGLMPGTRRVPAFPTLGSEA